MIIHKLDKEILLCYNRMCENITLACYKYKEPNGLDRGNSYKKERNLSKMNRYKSREQAFAFIFEKIFNDEPVEELIMMAIQERIEDEKVSKYAEKACKGVYSNLNEIDKLIDDNTNGWKFDRLAKSTIAILRLAIYEMLFEESIPINVTINEAVELSKKYCDVKDSSFINGILGTISKKIG